MLELVTPAATAAIALGDAKAYLRITSTAENDIISRIVSAATGYVEDALGRSLINTTWRESFECFPVSGYSPINLQRAPLSSVTTIKYYDTDGTQQTWSSDEYFVFTPREVNGFVRLDLDYSWPGIETARPYAVEVDYVAGYGAAATSIPAALTQAVYMIVDHWYRYRGAFIGQTVNNPIDLAITSLLHQQTTGAYP
jgi:uncharacterized phiE125 gp8 family phage protein